jgi:hypothetical protein
MGQGLNQKRIGDMRKPVASFHAQMISRRMQLCNTCHGRIVFLFVSELESLSLDVIRWLVT